MHPVLFRLGPLTLRTYGLLLALAFVSGIWLAIRRARKQDVKATIIMDLALIILITSIVGSRFFYVIFHLQEFTSHPLDIINPFQSNGEMGIGGLSMIGGVVLAIASSIIYLYLKKASVWKVADICSPSFALGLGLARIGCYMNGCCFGKPTESSCGVVFPPDSPAGFTYPVTPIYPAQLFSSLMGFLILFILLWTERYKKGDGFVFWLMLILYSAGRFTVDFFRYYEESMVFATIGKVSFSVNQAFAVAVILFSLFMWNYFRKRYKKQKEI